MAGERRRYAVRKAARLGGRWMVYDRQGVKPLYDFPTERGARRVADQLEREHRQGRARTRRDLYEGQGVIITEVGLYHNRFGVVVRPAGTSTGPIRVRVYMDEGRHVTRDFFRHDLRAKGTR